MNPTRRHDPGQSAVEFALVLPLLLLLVVALLDVVALAADQMLADALARDAARVASTARDDDEARELVDSTVARSGARVAWWRHEIEDGVLTVRVAVNARTSTLVDSARWIGRSRHVVGTASFATEFAIGER